MGGPRHLQERAIHFWLFLAWTQLLAFYPTSFPCFPFFLIEIIPNLLKMYCDAMEAHRSTLYQDIGCCI